MTPRHDLSTLLLYFSFSQRFGWRFESSGMWRVVERLVPDVSKDSLWIKPTDALKSNFIGITTLHVSDSLSAHHQEFLAVHRHWYILCRFYDRLLPGAGWNSSSILLLVANGSSQLHKMYQCRCTAKNSWWWAETLPETCRVVITIKLEFSASVGFIHKEFVTIHGHTILKKSFEGSESPHL